MVDYDPANLDPFIPEGMVDLRDAYVNILEAIEIERGLSIQSALDKFDGHDFVQGWLEEELTATKKEDRNHTFQIWAWSLLREELITSKLVAYALDDQCQLHSIDRDFWISPYAPKALSLGKIEKIPLYAPYGRIVLNSSDVLHLYERYCAIMKNRFYFDFDQSDGGSKGDNTVLALPGEIIRSGVRGRRPTYDVKTLLIETARMILAGDIPDGKHGSKKAWLGRLRWQYEQVRGFNDLPSDDAISREIKPIFDERRGQPALQETGPIGQSSG